MYFVYGAVWEAHHGISDRVQEMGRPAKRKSGPRLRAGAEILIEALEKALTGPELARDIEFRSIAG